MADRVLITTDDLEQAVRVNASLEQAGFDTAMVSSLDDVRQAVRTPEQGAGSREPDAIVLTGGLHETTGQRLVAAANERSEEHTSELQSRLHLVCRLLLEKKKKEL